MKSLVSWNVNGIRACAKKGFVDWVNEKSPDIICLQEIKAEKNQFPEETLTIDGYDLFIFSAEKKGYSGVAVYSKEKPVKVHYGLGIEKFDNEGRTIILEYKSFVLFNCYFPNGQRDHGRVPYKLEFYDEILKRYKTYISENKNVIITGDFNTAHHPIDLANPKTNLKTTGFLPHEREWMDHYVNAGMIDTLRYFKPDAEGIYSWWTYRGDCRERNIGWRIDYFMVSKSLEENLIGCDHHPNVLGSDHCPIELVLKNA